ncbi:MAG: tetratricopeptide repeat-containing sulfotransferase family protein [Panacagrimonas sp.]
MEPLQHLLTLYRRKRYTELMECCAQCLVASPDDVQVLALLGAAQAERGDHAAAIASFRRLTELEPTQAVHWSNLGTALRAAGHYDQALHAYEAAAVRAEPTPAFLLNVALLHLDRLEYGKARTLLRQAAAKSPSNPEIRVMTAVAAYAQADDESARKLLSGLERSAVIDRGLWLRASVILMQTGAIDPAERMLRKLLDTDPGDGLARVRLAQLLERSNRIDEAEAILVKLPPEAASSEREFIEDRLAIEARLAERRGKFVTAEARYRRLLAQGLPEHESHHVRFPLARCLEAQRRHDETMAELEAAHASQQEFLRRSASHILKSERPAFAIADRGCDPADVAQWGESAAAPDLAYSPVFIVGFPRSGTTLLEQTLDAHPGLQAMDEQAFLQNAIDHLRSARIQYPDRLAAATEPQLQAARDFYFSRVDGALRRDPARRLVDKNPLNLLRLPGIARLFPHARIVLAVRHPCDVVLSCYQQHFRAPEFASLCSNLERLARAYVRAFDFWFSEATKLVPTVCEIRYERLVSDFENETRRAVAFLDLPWDPALLDPARRAKERGYISTPSYAQVTQPVNRSAIDRWRSYEKYFDEVRRILRPYLDRWGYEG